MAEKTSKGLQWAVLVVTLVIAIASPIIAVDRANNSNEFRADAAATIAKEAKEIAIRAEKQTQDNAKDFEYFKGKLEGTIKGLDKAMSLMVINHKEGLDKMDVKIDKLEVKCDEIIKIMSGFMRVDDAKR